MSVVKINAIHVPAGSGTELESRFAARKHAVDGAPGFEGFQLLRPVAGEDRYFVVTTWATEEDFRAWAADGAAAAHARPQAPTGGGHPDGHDAPDGERKPVATGADLLEFEVVEL